MRKIGATALGVMVGMGLAVPALGGALEAPRAEPQVEAPTQISEPSVDHWTGGWVGIGAGLGSSNYNIVGDLDIPPNGAPGSGSFELPDLGGEGFLGTVEAGYSMRMGENFVLGAQLDYTASNIDNDASFSLSDAAGSIEGDYRLRAQHMFTGAVRAGYLTSETTQIYGLLGYTRGRFDADFSVSENGASVLSGGYDFDLNGVSLGAGIETMIADNMSLKLEYRYTRFEDENLIDVDGVSVDAETSLHTARMGVNYRF